MTRRKKETLVLQNPWEAFSPVNYSATLKLFSNPSVHGPGRPLPFREDEGDSDWR